NDALYGLMRVGFSAARVLPMHVPLRLLGGLAPHIFIRSARRARRQLREILPDLDPVRVTRRMFVHFAESLWELSRLHRSVPELDASSRQVLDAVLAEGKGAMVISGHIGNWELLGHAIAAAGYPIATIAKPSYDPRITQWLQQWRSSRGLQIVWSDEGNAGKMILSVLRRNRLMAFLIDQNTKTAGNFVPFFSRPAFTSTTPAAIALRTGAPIIFCWHHRRGKRHQMSFERISYAPTGDRTGDILKLTAIFNDRLEHAIRQAPEQWVWLHARWGRSRGNLS
ncbi:MAG TPA: lysophospholipid acyltransferase family protein, partial [Candidatus Limnocylindria bacterium]|nr:lysophospholipid acyltransferase family protein [Candidatus Limnocylindria bacterium]